MGLIRAAAILAIDNRFRTPSFELKCLGTSFGGQNQKLSIPWLSTWLSIWRHFLLALSKAAILSVHTPLRFGANASLSDVELSVDYVYIGIILALGQDETPFCPLCVTG